MDGSGDDRNGLSAGGIEQPQQGATVSEAEHVNNLERAQFEAMKPGDAVYLVRRG